MGIHFCKGDAEDLMVSILFGVRGFEGRVDLEGWSGAELGDA